MADDGGVETEVGEFLFGIIKILQPENVLETGTYTGVSAMYMGAALKDNGHGHLTTLEYEKTHKDRAERLWGACEISEFITCKLQSSLDFHPEEVYDLLFLDSEINIRLPELVNFFPHLKPGGWVLIHDIPTNVYRNNFNPDHPEIPHWPMGEIPEQIKVWVQEGKLRPLFFPNPRGVLAFYKPKEEEYNWK